MMSTVKMSTLKMSETRVRRLLEASKELGEPVDPQDTGSADDSEAFSKRPTRRPSAPVLSAASASGLRRRESKLPVVHIETPDRAIVFANDADVDEEAAPPAAAATVVVVDVAQPSPPKVSDLSSVHVELQPIFDTSYLRVVGYDARVVGEVGDDLCLRRHVRGLAVLAREGIKNEHGLLFIDVSDVDLLDPELFDANSPLGRIADKVVLQLRGPATTIVADSGSSVSDLAARISVLRFQGFRFALGDFEAAPSRLSLLAALSPEYIKLDESLTRGVSTSAMKRHVVEGLIKMCSLLGSTPIAEGVATAEDRAAIAEVGCVLVQGDTHSEQAAIAVRPIARSRSTAKNNNSNNNGASGTTQRSATRDTFFKRVAGQR